MKAPVVLRAIGLAALTTFTVGLAFAQDPVPVPVPASQAPASDALPVPPPPGGS